MREADVALGRLREALSAHLLHLGEQVSGDEGRRGIGGSSPDRPDLGRLASGARAAVQEAQDSFQANHRARRYHDQVRGYAETFTALSRVGLLVDDLYALAEDEPWGQDVLEVDAELREPMGRALAELAAAVPHVGLQDTELGRRESVDAAVGELYAALREHEVRHGTDPQALVVAAIATTLRRTLSVLSPAEMRLSNPADLAA